MKSRAQAGLEYLLTYGWAFVLVMTILGVLVFVITPASAKVNFSSSDRRIMLRSANVAVGGGTDSVSLTLQNATGGPIEIEGVTLDGAYLLNSAGNSATLNGTSITSISSGSRLKVVAGGQMIFTGIDTPANLGDVSTSQGITIVYRTNAGYQNTAKIAASGKAGGSAQISGY